MARCAAPLKGEPWYDYDKIFTNTAKRCRYKAQEDSIFCGNHKGLERNILAIIWKEDEDELRKTS